MTLRWLPLFCLLAVLASPVGGAQEAESASPESPSLTAPEAVVFDAEAELARLEPFFDSEERAIEAVRQFDRIQQRLASWDGELSQQYSMEGDEALSQAAVHRAETRIRTARKAYQLVLGHYPNCARAHNYIGELEYDWLGNQAAAIMAWKQASALDDQLAAPRNNLAIHYCHVGEYELGLRNFDEAMAIEPDNPDYLYNLAQIFLIHPDPVQQHYKIKREEVYKRAMKMSHRATELSPQDYSILQDYAVNFYAGENFGVKVKWNDAAKAWQAARERVRRSDELFYTWLNEGRVWLRAERNDEAARCFREALAILPTSTVAQQLLDRAEGRS